MNAAVELYNNLLIQAAELEAQHQQQAAAMDVDGDGDGEGEGEGGDDIQVGVVEYIDAEGFVSGGANCWLSRTDNGREVLVLEGGTNDVDGVARNFWQMSVFLEENISATLKGVAAHIVNDQLPGHYVSIAEFGYCEGESEEPLYATINQRMDLPDMTWEHLRNAEWGSFKLTFRLG
jgi:hypothetical protein